MCKQSHLFASSPPYFREFYCPQYKQTRTHTRRLKALASKTERLSEEAKSTHMNIHRDKQTSEENRKRAEALKEV